MKIYTRSGDRGETGLYGGARVPKSHPRIDGVGLLDEANSVLGWAAVVADEALANRLATYQSRLFDLGAHVGSDPTSGRALPGLEEADVAEIEADIDRMDDELAPLRAFILPGGTELAARLHMARSIVRRAERALVALSAEERLDKVSLRWLNRLSDWLFVAARYANHQAGCADVPWSKREP